MKAYPILRLTIFMVAGIFFAGIFPDYVSPQNLHVVLCGLALLLGLGIRKASYAKRWVFGTGVSVFMFLVGWILAEHERDEVWVDWPVKEQIYRTVLQDVPVEKTRSIQCKVEVNGKNVLLYLAKDSLASTLEIGDELWAYTDIQIPQGRRNPYEFDYAHYWFHQGISGTAYVPSGYWFRKERISELYLKQQALLVRERAIQKYREWGVEEEQLPVLSALTLGCKRELHDELREVYADAGISHVLALSGMHIGIIWLLLNFLLSPLGLIRGGSYVKWFVSTGLLWSAAFVVGLEASVVRAVWMCMLMELAKLAGGRALSMNTLAIAALLMLFYHPFYIYDVGFQLSFVAVASIVLFRPLILKAFAWRNPVLRYVGGVMAVSVAAQIGTAPLVMYYFSNFSVYFLVTNLLAAVWIPLILYGAVVMVLVSPCSWLLGVLVSVVNASTKGLTVVAEWIGGLPGATFSVAYLSGVEIVLLYGILGIILLYGMKPRRALFLKGLALFTCLLAFRLIIVFPEQKQAEIVFYNFRNCPAIHLIESDGSSYLITEQNDSAIASLVKVADVFWKREGVEYPVIVSKEQSMPNGIYQDKIVVWHGLKIGILSDNRWKDKSSELLLDMDYLYLCHGFNQDLKSLQKLFKVKTVVLDASLGRTRAEQRKKECMELGLDFVDLEAEGSHRIFL